ncbi:hypothetical protein LZ578_08455 [Jeotgalibaca sp. MA1X17-3]|uniref:hypothetical protein n=1 Tax=Jeotgalibaca sp. MA1X17-3 TaxID=2908211 RepID=UPI001F2AD2E7|nr:hypothetical protein [Jeotgalibaca sp. MA1X17-3]UJF15034.1 hypothetical protein LZ578_08455 [Jeotgalibaca sp. MA1X17-3]
MKKPLRGLVYLSVIPLFIYYMYGNNLHFIEVFNQVSILELFIILMMMFYSIYIHTFLHEGGHLLFGKLTGYSLLFFQAGNYRYEAKTKKITKQDNSIPGMLGQCLMVPPKSKDYQEKPYFFYLAGGLFINAITGILLYVGSFYFPGKWGFYSFLLSIIPILFLFLNMIPMGYTDGKVIMEIKKNSLTKKLFFQQLEMAFYLDQGHSFLEIPDSYYEEAETGRARESFLGEYIQICEYRRQLTKLDFALADQRLAEFLAHTNYRTSVYAPLLMCEELFCDALFGRKKVPEKSGKRFINFQVCVGTIQSQYALEQLMNILLRLV